MNAIAHECLEYILLDTAAWKATREGKLITGYEPQMSYIQHELIEAREARFYDEVYFPHLQRLMEIVKRWGLFQDATWELRELGYFQQIMCWVPNDTEYQDIIGEHMQFYTEPVWNNDQWVFEEFHVSRDDVLGLGVRPGELAAVQQKLF